MSFYVEYPSKVTSTRLFLCTWNKWYRRLHVSGVEKRINRVGVTMGKEKLKSVTSILVSQVYLCPTPITEEEGG